MDKHGALRSRAQASPGVDISGYWTPPMDEDALERGAGSELGDYAGFALNEAGRLWALSYDPSRLADRYHQCDAYVTAISNARGREFAQLGGA